MYQGTPLRVFLGLVDFNDGTSNQKRIQNWIIIEIVDQVPLNKTSSFLFKIKLQIN
jgi:hypothetical protein